MSKEMEGARLHLLQQSKKLRELFGTMNPTDARLKEWKTGLDEVQSNLKSFDATYQNQPVIKNGVTAERDSLGRYLTQCVETYNKHAKTPYKLTIVTPAADPVPASGQQTQASPPSSNMEKSLKEGQATAKSLEAPAEEAGKGLVNGEKKIWNGAGEIVSDAKDAISGDTKKDANAPASTPASAAEVADGKNKEGNKDKKSFLDGLNIGDILGGLLGGVGGFMLGNMFGGGMIGNIVGIMLAVGGIFVGKKHLGEKLNGWMGRKSDTPTNGPKKDGAERGQQAQKEAGAPAGTSKNIEQEKDKPAPTPSDAYSVYQAYLASKQPAESATAYTYINPAMDPSPEPTQPPLAASNAWRKQTPNFRH